MLTSVTDPGGNTWKYTYDVRGRKTTTTDPDKGTASVTFDVLDRQVTATDARGVTLTTEYDALGRATVVKNGSTVLTRSVYDTLAKGQLTSSTRYVDGAEYTNAVTGYNDRYQPTGRTVTIPAVEDKLAGSYTWSYYYNAQTGKPEGTLLPAAGGLSAETVGYTYENLLGLPQGTAGSLTYVQNTSYDKYASPSGYDESLNGKRVYQRFAYDSHTRRLTDVSVTRDTAPVGITDTHYTYDDAGNVTGITEQQKAGAGTIQTDAQCFSYDPLGRMNESWTSTTTTCDTSGTGTPHQRGWPRCVLDQLHVRFQRQPRWRRRATGLVLRIPSGPIPIPGTRPPASPNPDLQDREPRPTPTTRSATPPAARPPEAAPSSTRPSPGTTRTTSRATRRPARRTAPPISTTPTEAGSAQGPDPDHAVPRRNRTDVGQDHH
ncbi:RHS repeat domain-containing protein [Yinghuangia aomiensis]